MKNLLPFAMTLIFLSHSGQCEGLISSLDVGLEGSWSFMASYTTLLYNNNQDSIQYGRGGILESSLFVDINRLITASIGVLRGFSTMDTAPGYNTNPDIVGGTYLDRINQLNLGLGLKIPFDFYWPRTGWHNAVALSAGIQYTPYLSGTINGLGPVNSDVTQTFSPFFAVLGAEYWVYLDENWSVRAIWRYGFALNAEVSDSYYAPETYSSVWTYKNTMGLELAYKLW